MDIPLFKIYWDDDDLKAVSDSIKRGMNWAAGPSILEFENLISKYTGRKYAVVFNSGTSALHALLLAYGIGKGDEVIVPSFSFIATSNPVLFVSAKPVFADIEEETCGLNSEDVRKKITPKTKAVIAMHYGGAVSKEIRELKKIAKENNLLLIEDAAESFGARLNDQKVGTFGDSAMFSFCQTKVFTTGEGGSIVTDSKDIFEKLKLIRAHGRAEDSNYFSTGEYMDYVSLGYNFRMADISAALGVSQIKKVDKLIEKRREKAQYLTKALSGLMLNDIFIYDFPAELYHVYQEYPIRVKSGEEKRDSLKKYLSRKGIGTRISFKPIHLTHFYKNVLGYSGKLEVTEKVSREALSLPIYPDLTIKEINYIAQEIKNFYG
ncbi:MAG: DegT/DnrJ/EryC1/StrS family aminotransferase [Candidatus Pacebacteria bacterium]|nr:DegT/DnrJ/EryC1/StrS family aminotransferase [Candidatus Paceibacterota bacterium]